MLVKTAPSTLPTATLTDTLGIMARVVGPTIAKGPIIRRPKVVGLADRLDLDRKAVRCMQRLRVRYGPGPLMLPVPGQPRAVILAPEHVRRVLDNSPDPFSTDSSEKHAALSHFEPGNVLISRGAERAERRRYNEAVLETGQPMHHLARRFVQVVDEEGGLLLQSIRGSGILGWRDFLPAWFRIVRRVVLGDAARDDQTLTDQIAQLRSAANWAMLRPKRRRLRTEFFRRLEHHLARAEPGSLAEVMAATHGTPSTAAAQQVPQWLFAFDPAGMTTFRALALLATHIVQRDRALVEIEGTDGSRHPLPLLRAIMLEAVRLWPTTPLVLRQTSRDTEWDAGIMPANTGVVIYAPFFHRDDDRLPFADRLAPELWLQDGAEEWPLIPFSRGPAVCPGRELVLLLGSAMLAHLLRSGPVCLASRQLDPARPLPATLNNYALRFDLGG